MGFWKEKKEGNVGYHSLDKRIIKAFNKIREKDKRKYLCHAPFKSLCFFHTGAVLACWYNKLFPLGHYPEHSVHEIWLGRRATLLRDYILHHDLTLGCGDCKRNLENRNFHAPGPYRYDFLPEATGDYPVSIDFQISNECNLQCIMCNGEFSQTVRTQRENQPVYKNPYDEAFFEQIEKFLPYLKEASFSGGEPFFCKDFFRLWDLMIKNNVRPRLSVTTNGNLLNERIKKYLEHFTFNITVSLDAITEETYNKIRINGNLSKVLSHMEFFHDYTRSRKTSFGVKICPMRQNWVELPELIEYLNQRQISFLFNTVFFPPYCALWNLSSEQLNKIADYLGACRFDSQTEIQKQNIKRFQELIFQIKTWAVQAVEREALQLHKKNISELKEIFLKNTEQYLTSSSPHLIKDIQTKSESIRLLTEKLIQDTPDEQAAKNGMLFFASAPADRLLAEIEIRDYQKTLDRFFQICQSHE